MKPSKSITKILVAIWACETSFPVLTSEDDQQNKWKREFAQRLEEEQMRLSTKEKEHAVQLSLLYVRFLTFYC